MTTKARVGIGNVDITIDDVEYQMVPTLAAAQNISRLNGGIRGAIDSVLKLDLDVITRIVQVGVGPKVAKELGGEREFAEKLWALGMTDAEGGVAAKCVQYLTMLANGGRPTEEARDDTQDPPTT